MFFVKGIPRGPFYDSGMKDTIGNRKKGAIPKGALVAPRATSVGLAQPALSGPVQALEKRGVSEPGPWVGIQIVSMISHGRTSVGRA